MLKLHGYLANKEIPEFMKPRVIVMFTECRRWTQSLLKT
jgi:hypothetical protein